MGKAHRSSAAEWELDRQANAVVEDKMRYLPAYGPQAQRQVIGPESGDIQYFHDDLIGSTVLLTDGAGQPAVPPGGLAYTAFGEAVTVGGVGVPPGNVGTRYQYAGGWGYESGLLALAGANPALAPITLQHVGWRWYQPSIGRFIQRDPIGIAGGLNVYTYVACCPTILIDPDGELSLFGWLEFNDEWRRYGVVSIPV